MLLLQRKKNQEIVIGEHIVLRVVRIKGNVVQLGIDAPRDVGVIRAELANKAKSNGDGHTHDRFLNGNSTKLERQGESRLDSRQQIKSIKLCDEDSSEDACPYWWPFAM